MQNQFLKIVLKALNNLVSVKAGIFVASCGLLIAGNIDQHAWVNVVMVVVGARTTNELTAIIKKRDE